MGKYLLLSVIFALVLNLYSSIPSLACTSCSSPPPAPSPSQSEPCPAPPSARSSQCPIDTLKLGACVDLLGGLVHVGIGQGATDACCPLIAGLAGHDAALCLCTTIRAKLLNVEIILPVALNLLVGCGKNPPSGYQCPA